SAHQTCHERDQRNQPKRQFSFFRPYIQHQEKTKERPENSLARKDQGLCGGKATDHFLEEVKGKIVRIEKNIKAGRLVGMSRRSKKKNHTAYGYHVLDPDISVDLCFLYQRS